IGRLDFQQHGGFKIKALLGATRATGGDGSTGFSSFENEFLRHLPLSRGDEWANLSGFFQRIADTQLFGRSDELLDKRAEDFPVHKHAAARAAILAGVGKDTHWRAGRRLFEISVLKNNVR